MGKTVQFGLGFVTGRPNVCKVINNTYEQLIDQFKDTENKVYVKTVFTVIQPTYTKVFELDPVIYSKGGTEVTPLGLADFQ